MIKLSLVLTFLLSASGAMAQGSNQVHQTRVQLVANVIGTERIDEDSDLYVDSFILNLRFRNQGKAPLLIYKRNIGVSHVWISENNEKLDEQLFEASTASTLVYGGLPNNISINDFAVVEGGQAFETEVRIPVLTRKLVDSSVPGTVSPGRHAVKIQVQTWFAEKNRTQCIEQMFRKNGQLVSDPLTSEAFEITTN